MKKVIISLTVLLSTVAIVISTIALVNNVNTLRYYDRRQSANKAELYEARSNSYFKRLELEDGYLALVKYGKLYLVNPDGEKMYLGNHVKRIAKTEGGQIMYVSEDGYLYSYDYLGQIKK